MSKGEEGEEKGPVSHAINRRYEGSATGLITGLVGLTRAERVEKYQRDMKPFEDAKLAKARAALAEVEARVGVKDVTKPPKDSVTKPPEGRVTKPLEAGPVTKPQGGRPPVAEQTMSAAERMRRMRAEKKGSPK